MTGGADVFIGFGGVVERPVVAAGADWYVYDYADLVASLRRYTVRLFLVGVWELGRVG